MLPATQSAFSDLNPSPLEELSPGLTFQWIFDGKGIAFYAQHSSRELMDAMTDRLSECLGAWGKSRKLYVLVDFSAKDCVVTPYNQQKIRALSKIYPDTETYSAVIVQQNLSMILSRILIRTLPSGKNTHLCFNKQEGINWLKNKINEFQTF
jgi:hypothetical protein